MIWAKSWVSALQYGVPFGLHCFRFGLHLSQPYKGYLRKTQTPAPKNYSRCLSPETRSCFGPEARRLQRSESPRHRKNAYPRSSSREDRVRVPDCFLSSNLVGEPSPQKRRKWLSLVRNNPSERRLITMAFVGYFTSLPNHLPDTQSPLQVL